MKKIMITGANGFSGDYILNNCKIRNFKFIGTSKNKKKKSKLFSIKKCDLTRSFNFPEVDWIIHTASNHLIADFKKSPKIKFKKNILMTENLINYCKKNDVKNFIFFSTIDITYQILPKQKKMYIKSKIACEKMLLKAYQNKIIKNLIFLRLPAIIGKNCNINFLSKTLHNMKKNKKIKIWNSDLPYNNFIHIDDVLRLIKHILKKSSKRNFQIFNCLSANPITLKKLILFMKNSLGSKSIIKVQKDVGDNIKINKSKNLNKFNFYSSKKNLLNYIKTV